jgi:hypothetical protein
MLMVSPIQWEMIYHRRIPASSAIVEVMERKCVELQVVPSYLAHLVKCWLRHNCLDGAVQTRSVLTSHVNLMV